MIIRFLFGTCYGLGLVVSAVCNAEIMPLKYRGKAIITLNIFTSIGRMLSVLTASYYLIG